MSSYGSELVDKREQRIRRADLSEGIAGPSDLGRPRGIPLLRRDAGQLIQADKSRYRPVEVHEGTAIEACRTHVLLDQVFDRRIRRR